MTFGYATGEFEVTEERLGCYRPEEHIDNPKVCNLGAPGAKLTIVTLHRTTPITKMPANTTPASVVLSMKGKNSPSTNATE